MKPLPSIPTLLVTNHQVGTHDTAALNSFAAYLHETSVVSLEQASDLPEDLSKYQAIILTGAAHLSGSQQRALTTFVRAGGGALALIGRDEGSLPPIFGAEPGQLGCKSELRILFADHEDSLRHRLPEMNYLQGHYHLLTPKANDVETVLYADWRFAHSPVLTRCTVGDGQAAASTLQDLSNRWLQKVLYRLLCELGRTPFKKRSVGVGILGYSPAVGLLHGVQTAQTKGLELRAICDLNPRRVAEAQRDFPHASIYESADAFGTEEGLDLVVIATPPSTHAELAVRFLNLGKHVVCEKPLALTGAEVDGMLKAADENGCFIGCHQNRRWDVDYLAVKEAVMQKRIGDLFYVETFVGSFNHPCGYWHSHDAISGGTAYDWGAHYLDWMLSLIPETVTGVISTRQNQVWHDVTNADQERIQLRFSGGQEADFTHSDIAAARKPKWYLLGTEGAIVGHWRDVISYETDVLRYFEEHRFPATEIPPTLRLYRHLRPDGEETNRTAEEHLVLPERVNNGFHANLADHLLTGEPVEVPVEHSARVVAVLEMASRSAEKGGTLEKVAI